MATLTRGTKQDDVIATKAYAMGLVQGALIGGGVQHEWFVYKILAGVGYNRQQAFDLLRLLRAQGMIEIQGGFIWIAGQEVE